MRVFSWPVLVAISCVAIASPVVGSAQEGPVTEAASRQAALEQVQAEKLSGVHPFVPGKVERLLNRFDTLITYGPRGWHPYLQNAYAGGGFAVGAGYLKHVSGDNFLDVRGSYSLAEYKRAEVEFMAPRLFERRGTLSVIGGWREATQVAYYGTGMSTSSDGRVNYGFRQPFAAATMTFWPYRRGLLFRGGSDVSRWSLRSGKGTFPSIETVYPQDALAGVDAETTYIHTRATAGFDWRTAEGYSRRGGVYSVTAHDYTDRDSAFGFRQVDYAVTQHIPILREAWVLSFNGAVQTTFTKSDQDVPFFMLPSLGGGSTLRGFSSWRFRDRHSLLLQAEWRIMVNRFLDTAVFYDAGKVASRTADLDLQGLKSDFGFGARFHGPLATPLRVELARGNEGLRLVFAASAAF